jgi:prepilin-type N-terminal cleavage/methylation domain-containing protein
VNERGFSLLEVLLAVALVGIVIMGVVPAFITCKDVNARNEVRSGALAAAQRLMEEHRRVDPATLPSSGSSSIQLMSVGKRDYEVVAHYCIASALCDHQSRHITIEAGFGNETLLTIEAVFTKLR